MSKEGYVPKEIRVTAESIEKAKAKVKINTPELFEGLSDERMSLPMISAMTPENQRDRIAAICAEFRAGYGEQRRMLNAFLNDVPPSEWKNLPDSALKFLFRSLARLYMSDELSRGRPFSIPNSELQVINGVSNSSGRYGKINEVTPLLAEKFTGDDLLAVIADEWFKLKGQIKS
jgi:hypothetical protein